MCKFCPVCGEGHVINETYTDSINYAGGSISYERATAYCDACGTEMPTPEMVKSNCRAINYAKNIADGLLIGEEICNFRTKFSIPQELAAKIFGGGKTTFSKYESNDICHNTSMDRLLRLCIERPENIVTLAAIANIELSTEVKAAIYRNRRHQPVFDMSFIKASMLGAERFVSERKTNSEDYFYDQKKVNKDFFPPEELLAA